MEPLRSRIKIISVKLLFIKNTSLSFVELSITNKKGGMVAFKATNYEPNSGWSKAKRVSFISKIS